MNWIVVIRYELYNIFLRIYNKFLLSFRKDDFLLTEEKYQFIKKCAEAAYSNDKFYPYKDYENMDEFISNNKNIGKGQLYVLTGNDWYFIMVKYPLHIELVDFAASSRRCSDILNIFLTVKGLFYGKKFKMICLEKTSYPLMKFFAKRGNCIITKDEVVIIENERNHRLTVKFSERKKSRQQLTK